MNLSVSGIFVQTALYSPFTFLKDLFFMTQLDPSALRKTLRNLRQQLTQHQQKTHSEQACQLLIHASLLTDACKVAVFLSQDGELGTEELIQQLWKNSNTEVYLPALETSPNWHMGFSLYKPNSKLIPNKFNILEPDIPVSEHLSGNMMDLVIVPLVGFDKAGNRLGMGGGYYDRTFEFKHQQPNAKPLLVGWAHSCQHVEKLPNEAWDVPLNALVTEQEILYWNKK